MGFCFNYLLNVFEDQLAYYYYYKSLYLVSLVFLGFIFYLLLSLFIKAFKYDDIKLKY